MSKGEFSKVLDLTLLDLVRVVERLNKFGDGSDLGELGSKYRNIGRAVLMIDSYIRELKLDMAQSGDDK